MEELKIRIQSEIDVITNSSTSIYTVSGDYTIDRLKEIINSLLSLGGSKETADDLFDIYLDDPDYFDDEYDDDFIDHCWNYVLDKVIVEGHPDYAKVTEADYIWSTVKKEYNQVYHRNYSLEYEMLNAASLKIEEYQKKYITRDIKREANSNYQCDLYNRDYVIKPKNNDDLLTKRACTALSHLDRIFDIDAKYDG